MKLSYRILMCNCLLSLAVCWPQSSWSQQASEQQNSIGMVLVSIPAGTFSMGSGKDFNDKPVHKVTLTKAFKIGKTEVTQGQFKAVMGYDPSWLAYRSDDTAVDCVSWFEALEFCKKLGEMEGQTYRLPTEAEWEYAARAGTSGMFYFSEREDAASQIGEHGFVASNSDGTPQPVGQKPANPWGLHDVYGNVYEWCSDWHHRDGYPDGPVTDPTGLDYSDNLLGTGAKVTRGGSVLGRPGINQIRTERTSSTARNGWIPYAKARAVGFRVVAEIN